MEAENISETINNKIIILLDEAEYDNYKFQSTKHLPVPWQCDAFFRQTDIILKAVVILQVVIMCNLAVFEAVIWLFCFCIMFAIFHHFLIKTAYFTPMPLSLHDII